MTTKNIQDIVAEFEKKISSCTHVHGFHTCVLDDPEDKETYKQRAKDWLTTTLTQLVKEVEAGERELLEEITKELNQVKNTSEGTQDWYNGIRATRSVVETIAARHGLSTNPHKSTK